MKKRMKRRLSRQSGFTLMEIMLVLIILAAVTGIVAMNVLPQRERAFIRAAEAQIGLFRGQISNYQFEVLQLPEKLEDLHVKPSNLPDPDKWIQILDKPVPNDPWGQPYEYKVSGDTYDLRSLGPDKQSGTDDDITATPKQS